MCQNKGELWRFSLPLWKYISRTQMNFWYFFWICLFEKSLFSHFFANLINENRRQKARKWKKNCVTIKIHSTKTMNMNLITRSMLVISTEADTLSLSNKKKQVYKIRLCLAKLRVWLICNFDGISVFRQHIFALIDSLGFLIIFQFIPNKIERKKMCCFTRILHVHSARPAENLSYFVNKVNVVCVKRL